MGEPQKKHFTNTTNNEMSHISTKKNCHDIRNRVRLDCTVVKILHPGSKSFSLIQRPHGIPRACGHINKETTTLLIYVYTPRILLEAATSDGIYQLQLTISIHNSRTFVILPP